MKFLPAVVTLFFIMDPLGTTPLFVSALKDVPPERRRRGSVRGILFTDAILRLRLLRPAHPMGCFW